jgi:hypothetical protein
MVFNGLPEFYTPPPIPGGIPVVLEEFWGIPVVLGESL